MKIAVITNALKPQLSNIFIESFKSVNTKHNYDFYVNLYNKEDKKFFKDKNISFDEFKDISNYINQIEILSETYDYIITSENSVFCLKSIDNLIDSLNGKDFQIFGNTEYNTKVNVDTNFEVVTRVDDFYINLDFAILNCKNLSRDTKDFIAGMMEEEVDYLDRVALNIVNNRKIVNVNFLMKSIYINQIDYKDVYNVNFDDLDDLDICSPTYYFLQRYYNFIKENDLEIPDELRNNIEHKLKAYNYDIINKQHILNYFDLCLGREECSVTITKNI